MKHDRAHFEREADKCVPHLTPEERRKWIDQCHAEHPGHTDAHLTGQPINRASAIQNVTAAGPSIDEKARKADQMTIDHLGRRALQAEHEAYVAKRNLRVALAVILALIILLAVKTLHGQEAGDALPPPPPTDLPLPIEPSDRERLKDLWVEGFLAFARVEDANVAAERYSRQAAEAKLDASKRQKELDETNAKIAATIGGFRDKYKAGDKWCLTKRLLWEPNKTGDKNLCPPIFSDDTAQQPPSR